MFTGIIQEIGTIQSLEKKSGIIKIGIKAPKTAKLLKIGDSISVDGACLTVIEKKGEIFWVEAIPETLKRTICGEYKTKMQVNLEPSMQLSDRFHGHLVSGHVDFIGKVTSKKTHEDSVIIGISYPQNFGKYLSMKGSITVNGASLTISKINPKKIEINLIPHTMKKTNLNNLKEKNSVNVEIDLIARYLEGLIQTK